MMGLLAINRMERRNIAPTTAAMTFLDRLRLLCSATFLALAVTSCSTLYEVGYGWALDGHAKDDALAVEVDDLHFRFHPTVAGVAFSVENKGGEDAGLHKIRSS